MIEGFWSDFAKPEEGKTEVESEHESPSRDDAKPKQELNVIADEKVEQDARVDVNSKPEERPKEKPKENQNNDNKDPNEEVSGWPKGLITCDLDNGDSEGSVRCRLGSAPSYPLHR